MQVSCGPVVCSCSLRTMPMGTMAMIGTPYGSDIGISPGSMPPWKPPGSCCPGGG